MTSICSKILAQFKVIFVLGMESVNPFIMELGGNIV